MNLIMDLVNGALVKNALRPASISSATTTTGPIVDMLLANHRGQAHLIVNKGAITNGTFVLQLTESDDSGMSGATNITAGSESGTVTLTSADTNAASPSIIRFLRTKRYVQLSIVSTGGTVAGVLSATIVAQLSRPGATNAVP